MLTLTQLKKIMPNAKNAASALPIINAVAKQYGINNQHRMAAWLATLAAESGELKYQEELASGAAYEGRADLGNTQKGDGRKFKGHGRIQITGRDNHTKYTEYLRRAKHLPFVDFVAEPKRLAEEPYATDAAGWFWTVYKKLNGYADKGDFLTTQIKVNGRNKKTGLPNHYDVRQRYYTRALAVLPDDFSLDSVASKGSLDPTPVEETDSPIKPEPSDTSVPPPTNSDVVLNAPAKDGATATSTKLVIAGITVPTFLVPIVTVIKDAATEGYIDVKEVLQWMLDFIKENHRYVLILIGLLIILLIVKKILKQVTFWLTILTHAIPSWHSITVQPAESTDVKWWQIWK